MPKEFEKNKEFIGTLSNLGAGDLAILRRCGDDYFSNPRALPVFAKIGALNSNVRSLIAVLYSVFHSEGQKPNILEKFNFGQTYFFALKGDNNDFKAENHDKRFKMIIASDFEQIPFRLRQLVKLIKSKDGMIDFADLLNDLYSWNSDSRWVQRKWVRGFYNLHEQENENKGENNEK